MILLSIGAASALCGHGTARPAVPRNVPLTMRADGTFLLADAKEVAGLSDQLEAAVATWLEEQAGPAGSQASMAVKATQAALEAAAPAGGVAEAAAQAAEQAATPAMQAALKAAVPSAQLVGPAITQAASQAAKSLAAATGGVDAERAAAGAKAAAVEAVPSLAAAMAAVATALVEVPARLAQEAEAGPVAVSVVAVALALAVAVARRAAPPPLPQWRGPYTPDQGGMVGRVVPTAAAAVRGGRREARGPAGAARRGVPSGRYEAPRGQGPRPSPDDSRSASWWKRDIYHARGRRPARPPGGSQGG